MFICMSFVKLQHPPGLPSSQRWWGSLPRSRTCNPMQIPHFTGFHIKVLMYLLCLNEQTVSLHQTLCRHTAKVPLPPLSSSQTYDILSPPPPSSQIRFTFSFTASVTFYGDDVHTFLPFTQFHPAWSSQAAGSEIFDKTLHSLQNRVPLRSSLPLSCRLLIVYHYRRICIKNGLFCFKISPTISTHSSLASGILETFRKVKLSCVAILSDLAENRFNTVFWPNAIWQAVEKQLMKPQIYSPCLSHSSDNFTPSTSS